MNMFTRESWFCFLLIDFKNPCVNQGLLSCFLLELVAFLKGHAY